MASSSTQKSSSSSAPTGKCNLDVFLSFTGEDTRYNFTDHLFVNLDRMGINTFRDDKLERGEEITQELLGTIEGSRFSIIVFWEKNAHSKWCLDELTKIMKCRKEIDQIALPVFYHVYPFDVRKQIKWEFWRSICELWNKRRRGEGAKVEGCHDWSKLSKWLACEGWVISTSFELSNL